MDKYTIYCTEEQAKKALKLGAPIKIRPYVTQEKAIDFAYVNSGIIFDCPTAEQMIGWLEEQGITSIEITFCKESKWKFEIFGEIYDYGAPYSSRKEATIAAIDAALDYLIKAK